MLLFKKNLVVKMFTKGKLHKFTQIFLIYILINLKSIHKVINFFKKEYYILIYKNFIFV